MLAYITVLVCDEAAWTQIYLC